MSAITKSKIRIEMIEDGEAACSSSSKLLAKRIQSDSSIHTLLRVKADMAKPRVVKSARMQ